MVRQADARRWQNGILRLLVALPDQYAALEYAMATFGGDFDVRSFRRAFDFADGVEAYTRAQAVERALGRVQNFVAELAELDAKLAELPPTVHGSPAERAFVSLRDAGAIDGELCRQLRRAQRARTRIEHVYLDVTAGETHRAARLIHDTAPRFLARYADWIEPFLPS
jgi:uncharacterized protein YutE (UPF0331/DUF86 family)